MRNIEEMAAEEELLFRRQQRRFVRKALIAAGLGMGLAGWIVFSRGGMDWGGFWILLSFASLLLGLGAQRIQKFSFFAWGGAFLTLISASLFYGWTQAPSFYWGQDPNFFLAVQAGAVTPPPWSPLAYLLGQAFSLALHWNFFTLPMLSAGLAGICFGGLALGWFGLIREKNIWAFGTIWLLAMAVLAAHPFWNAGTIASGTTAFLGLLLFIWQRRLLKAGEVRGESQGLLLGLLVSVHPAWGLLGLLSLALEERLEIENKGRALFFLGVGLTPYLWVVLRSGQFFPSWGGARPLTVWLAQSGEMMKAHFLENWDLNATIGFLGWAFLPILAATIAFGIYRWRAGTLSVLSKDILLWGAALILAVLFASRSSFEMGPTILWVFAGLAELLIRVCERSYGRKSLAGVSPRVGMPGIAVGSLLALAAAMGIPGQACFRAGFSFPEEHALNLIRGLEPNGVLICRDPFEAAACRVECLWEPLKPGILILDQEDLGRKWYLTQLMGRDARLLFSKIDGSTESILKDLINCNWGKRELEWDLSRLPDGWDGPPAVPTLLTQRFSQVPLSPEAAEDIQSRYDLTDLVGSIGDPNVLTKRYCQRYLQGFDSLGDWLVGQKKYSGAIRTYERVLELNPDDPTAKAALAKIYTQDNLLEAARLDFTRIVKTYPTRIREIMAQMDRMKVKNGANDAEVLESLNETVRLNTVLADAEYHLGQLYEKDGNVNAAKKMLQSAVRMNPQRLEAQVALGLLMEKTGDRQDAEAALREALRINPVDKTVQAELWKLLNKR